MKKQELLQDRSTEGQKRPGHGPKNEAARGSRVRDRGDVADHGAEAVRQEQEEHEGVRVPDLTSGGPDVWGFGRGVWDSVQSFGACRFSG